jgi:hypothetical protein
MNSATLLLLPMLLFFPLAPSLWSVSDSSPLPGKTVKAVVSADDFDWREVVPYLCAAADLPGEQGIKEVLENSRVFRTYIAREILAECRPDRNLCTTTSDGYVTAEEVSKRIDQIVQEEFFHQHKTATVDYPLTHQPFPFSEIASTKSEKHSDAYLMFAYAGRSYKAWQLQAKYGDPYDTDIVQWYSVYKYRLDTPRYTSKAVFEIDPVDGAVLKVAISVKLKNSKNHASEERSEDNSKRAGGP